MKKILKITALSLLTTPLFAQYLDMQFNHQYALAFTMPHLSGNARFASMGGAFGALGGNLSALSTNPASIGIYRNSEFSFTPALTIGQSQVRPIGVPESRSRDMDRFNFNVGNFGMVNVFDISNSDSPNEWKSVQFGFGMNRQADFWNRSYYTGYVEDTYLDQVTRDANLFGAPTGTIRRLAADADVIFWDTINGHIGFFNDLAPNGGLTQTQNTETRGGINEWFLSFGGNYGDFLYLGATIGMPSLNFRQTRTLTERDQKGIHNDFEFWRLRETLDISGMGINLKLGAIVRPTDFMRVGFAVHTPTRFALRENLTIEATGTRTHRERLPEFEYNIRTPMRLIGSLGFVIGRQALIGIEYEHLDYGRMRIGGFDPDFDLDNDFIVDNYRTGGVIRAGGEFRLDPVILRLGYNYTMTPFNTESLAAQKFSGHTFSAGLGFVLGTTTIDLAYVNTRRSYEMMPYTNMPWNQYNLSGHQFKVTFGWRF